MSDLADYIKIRAYVVIGIEKVPIDIGIKITYDGNNGGYVDISFDYSHLRKRCDNPLLLLIDNPFWDQINRDSLEPIYITLKEYFDILRETTGYELSSIRVSSDSHSLPYLPIYR